MATSAATLFPTGTKCTRLAWYYAQVVFRAGRLAYCPVERLFTKWIQQSGAGNSSGGSGTGTFANPYLVDTAASLATLVAAIAVTNQTIKLMDDSVFRGTTGLTTMTVGASTLTRSRTGTNAPCITGYLPESSWGGTWGQDGSSRWNRNLGATAYWVQDALNVANIVAGTDRVWTRCNSLADFDAHDVATYGPCFYITGTTVYIRYNAGNSSPSGLCEFIGRTTSLVKVDNVDGCRVDGLALHGADMQGAAGLGYNVDITCEGTNAAVVSDCTVTHGPLHLAVSRGLGGSAGHAGGIAYYQGSRFGGMRVDSAGAAYAITGYAYDGGHECICDANVLLYGALPDTGRFGWSYARRKQGGLYYAHGNGSVTLELFMACYNVVKNHLFGGLTLGVNGGALSYNSASQNRTWLLTNGRSFQWGNRHEGGPATRSDIARNYEVTMWERYANAQYPTNWGAVDPTMDFGGVQKHAVYIGCELGDDYEGISATGALLRKIIEVSTCYIDWVYGGDHNKNKASNWVAFDASDASTAKSATIRRFNSIWSTNAAASASGHEYARNAAPTLIASGGDASLVGGAIGCAFYSAATANSTNFGTPPAAGSYNGWTSTPDVVTLSSPAVAGAVPSAGSQLFEAATTQSHDYSDIEWWVDANGVDRLMPTRPSIGPEMQASAVIPPLATGRVFPRSGEGRGVRGRGRAA